MQMTPQGSVLAFIEPTSLLFAYVISLHCLTVGLIAECLHTQLFEPQCHVEVFKLCTAKPLMIQTFFFNH